MKLKMKEYNGAVALVVSGVCQDLIIIEENGGFTIEMVNTAPMPMHEPEFLQEEQGESCPVEMPTGEVESIIEEETPPPDNGLFEKLVALRKSLATADSVPPYLIFHNKTLQEMADKMPADMQEMGNIPGIGQAKLQKYGQAFLDIIAKGAA